MRQEGNGYRAKRWETFGRRFRRGRETRAEQTRAEQPAVSARTPRSWHPLTIPW